METNTVLDNQREYISYLEGLLEQNNIQYKKQIINENQIDKVEIPITLGPIKTNLDNRLNKQQIERYSRQMILPEIQYEGQSKLQQSKILVVGAGGIGAPALLYLSGAGIGTIGIIDNDQVEESNLHRQVIHQENRLGLNKAISAKKSIENFNSRVKVIVHATRLTPENAEQIVKDYDMVLDASDNPLTRYLINDTCIIQKKPLISGSAIGWEGQLTIFGYQDSPCYRCLYPICPGVGSVKSCGESGVLGPVPGIIGLLEAIEAIKLLVGKGDLFSQQMLIFDALCGKFRKCKLRPRQKNCVVCGDNPQISKVSAYDYNSFIGSQTCTVKVPNQISNQVTDQPKFENINWQEFLEKKIYLNPQNILLDVRSEQLTGIVHFEAFQKIPMDKLLQMKEDQLEQFLGKKTQNVFVMCRRGVNSKTSSNYLVQNGFKNVFNIEGGISEYASKYDSSIPFL